MAGNVSNNENLEFEVGIRFNPTDVELISQYLTKKVADSNFNATTIAEVDMNKKEPWDLPGLAKMGETEWYFFSLRTKKYTTGRRTNMATILGYWKTTGKDKQIIDANALIGMKKTLVFYIGRAPQGEKTNWVMHEYRLEECKYNLPTTGEGEWVICKVYKKANRGKNVEIPKFGPSPVASQLPPLMETFSYNNKMINTTCDLSQVNCFNDLIMAQNQGAIEDNKIVESKETTIWNFSSFDVSPLANANPPLVFNQPQPQAAQQIGNSHGDFLQPQEPSMLKMLMEKDGSSVLVNQKVDFSLGRDYNVAAHISPVVNNDDMFQKWYQNQENSSATSIGPFNFDCSWNY